MPNADVTDQHVLVRCVVQNRAQEASVRFVEHSHYRLWQYLMANKHDLAVSDGSLCLWMTDRELAGCEALYDGTGNVEPVVRLSFAQYDGVIGLCQTTQRFVPAAEAERVRDLLLSRVPPETRGSPDFMTRADPGYAVIRARDLEIGKLGSPFR